MERHDTDAVPLAPAIDEQEEIYRMLHRELESIDRRVTRARSRALGIPSTQSQRHQPRVRGPRPRRGRGGRGQRDDDHGLSADESQEAGPSAAADIPTFLEPEYDDDGNVLIDGDVLSSASSSGLDDDI